MGHLYGRILSTVAVTASLMSLLAAPASARRLVPVDSDASPASGLIVTVRDEATFLNHAHVWVETLDGKLLAEGYTGSDGRYVGDVSEAALQAGVSVTAAAENHGAVSFLENVAHRVTLELPQRLADAYATLNGRLTGFKEMDDESKAMVGLVAKAMELSDLANLDSSSFVSPLKDTIEVFGTRKIPSNIVLPDQTFPVYFIPVHVDKPTYRLPMLVGTSSRYFGVTGTVNVQDAINAIRGSNAWDIINLLEFSKVGVTPKIPATRGGDQVNFDVVSDTPIKETLKLKPGRNTTSGVESHRLAAALWEPAPGLFVPTDVKLVQSDDLTLTSVESRTARVMDILVDGEGDHFRGAWVNTSSERIGDAGLTADVVMNGLDGTWLIRGGETAQLVIAHVESQITTSVGNHRYDDRWVLVGPRKTQLRLPAVAYHAMREELGKISHVSVDLMQMGHTSYPFMEDSASGDLSVLEKVRKEIK